MRGLISLGVGSLLLASCAPPPPIAPSGQSTASSQPGVRPERTMVIALELEPKYISPLAPTISAVAQNFFLRPFNAFLELVDDNGRALPYLAEALPELHTDSWKVFPDGRMETRYRLKPDLTWHDNTPLTAADFAFSFKVATPAAGFSTAGAPYGLIDDVLAPDDCTIVIQWRELYPDVAQLQGGGARFGLAPFPRHILERSFQEDPRDAFANHPYWSREFVGAGPYKLDRWDLGSSIEAVAFDGHVLGRPKIERFKFLFPGDDQNTVVASLRAGAVDFAMNATGFPQGLELKREWATAGNGTVAFVAGSMAAVLFQFRPDYSRPPAMRDVRVRGRSPTGSTRPRWGRRSGAARSPCSTRSSTRRSTTIP